MKSSKKDLVELATLAGVRLPAGLVTWWQAGSPTVEEFDGLSAQQASDTWRSLVALMSTKAFTAKVRKHKYADDMGRVAAVHFSRDWIPFAQDSGGNLLCVDTGPGPKGTKGQIVQWEIRGGGAFVRASSIALLRSKGKQKVIAPKAEKPFVILFSLDQIVGLNKKAIPPALLNAAAWCSNSAAAADAIAAAIKEPRVDREIQRAVFRSMQPIVAELAAKDYAQATERAFHVRATVATAGKVFRANGIRVLSPAKLGLKSVS